LTGARVRLDGDGDGKLQLTITRRDLLAVTAALPVAEPRTELRFPQALWREVEEMGSGRPVALGAWAGDDRTNAFIAWAAERMRMLFDVRLRHVRLTEPADATRSTESLDLLSVDRASLAALSAKGFLNEGIAKLLPNAALIDRTRGDDFGFADGAAVPWRAGRFVLVHDTVRLPVPPRSMAALLAWAEDHPGRFAHPTARDPAGAAFLTWALMELAPDKDDLRRHATDAAYAAATARLWDWYEALRPALWRGGTAFPASMREVRALMSGGDIDLAMSLNPAEAVTEVAHRTLPETVRAFAPAGGRIAPRCFLAIPAAASNKAGALLTANFLLGAEAQARASDPVLLGHGSMLAWDRLPAASRAVSAWVPRPAARITDDEGGFVPEPHWSWGVRVAAEWERGVRG
jgi:putative thiamine transport system substrate-binding protein